MRAPAAALVLLASLCVRPPADASEPAGALHGRLGAVDGVKVLRVWGTPRERGRAHGALLGREILEIVNQYLSRERAKSYAETLLPALPALFSWPAHVREEIEGIHQGARETLGEEGLRIAALDRSLSVEDLLAFNSLGDWARLGCSTFTAWGSLTGGGRTLVGRNFDYFLPPAALKHQLVLAEEACDGRKAFATLSFPGQVGAITFLNESGVFGAVHDVHRVPEALAGGYTPRLAALRLVAEGAAGATACAQALAICRAHATVYGNVFHIAVPFGPGVETVAAVIEYDSDREKDGGATARFAEPGAPPALWNTNHFRARAPPSPCSRHDALRAACDALAAAPPLDAAAMQELIRKTSVAITMHVVVADLAARTLHVALQEKLMVSAGREPFRTLRWEEIFGPRDGDAEPEEEGF